jgi:hypothetical protein
MDTQISPLPIGSNSVVGSSRKSTRGVANQAGGEVEAPPHASRVADTRINPFASHAAYRAPSLRSRNTG